MSLSKGQTSSVSVEEHELVLAQNRRLKAQQVFFTDFISTLDEEKKEYLQKLREYTQLNSDLVTVISGNKETSESSGGDSVPPESPLTRLSRSNQLSLGQLTKTFQSHQFSEDISYSLHTESTSIAGEQSIQSLDSGFNPGVQQKLFQENLHLKQLLETISKEKGLSKHDFLKLYEYERITTQLRQELTGLYKQNRELVTILQARTQNNIEYVTKKYAQLFKKAIQQEKLLIAKRVLLDSALDEIEKNRPHSSDNIEDSLSHIKMLQDKIQQLENKAREYQLERDYLQRQCDELTDMVQTLMQGNAVTNPYPMSTKELREENESLRQQVSVIRQEGQRFDQVQGILNGQVEVLKDDLKKERELRQEEKQKNENLIRGFENQIRKLSEEGLHLNKQWTDEKSMNAKLNEQLDKMMKSYEVKVTPVSTALPIKHSLTSRVNVPRQFASHPSSQIQARSTAIRCDAGPGSPDSIDPGYGGSIQEQGSQEPKNLECPRCWQEFKPNQQKEFEAHRKICTD